MNKWYRMPGTKAILVLVTIITAVIVGINGVILLGFPSYVSQGDIFRKSVGSYEDSESFDGMLSQAAETIVRQAALGKNFETDGKYNPDKTVDIMEYAENGEISGENKSGIAYKLSDLRTWSRRVCNQGWDYEDGTIVVCEKPDRSYYYYYMSQFRNQLQQKNLRVMLDGKEVTADDSGGIQEFLSALEEGYNISDYYEDGIQLSITNGDGGELYTDCWSFSSTILKEEAAPIGAESLLDAVNNTPALSGKLEQVFSDLESALGQIDYEVSDYKSSGNIWSEGNTNLTYLFVDEEDKRVYTNHNGWNKYGDAEANIKALTEGNNTKYVIVKPKLAEFESNIAKASANEWQGVVEVESGLSSNYIFAAAVDTSYPVQDVFYSSAKSYNEYAPYLRSAGIIVIICIILFCLSIVWLTVVAGRKAEDEDIHLNAFDKWKTELAAAVVIVSWIFMTMLIGESWGGVGYDVSGLRAADYYGSTNHVGNYWVFSMSMADILVITAYVGLTAALFLIGYLSLVRRIKGHIVWKNSLIYWLGTGIGKEVETVWIHRSVTFRAALLFGGFIVLHWMAVASGGSGMVCMLMFAAEAAAGYFIIRGAVAKDKIRKGIEQISSGDVDYQIPTEGLYGEYLQMAEMVNNIGNGLQRAVEQGMKSERLKTDLITNVSHDIKTPLTSIINYVDLLKRENINDPKIQGYLDILEAKAQRLKVLTEDVVEASKVSSGNIKLEMMDLNLVEMLNQTVGEFAEKMAASKLEVITSFPEEPVVVHADGRRMWRVLENIFNNAAKYAMPGTRVYADVQTEGEKVQFSLKNISAQKLNIRAEELTERFIRGDISRSTEGSGLGLSIAKNLTEMQGGAFELYLDGDLFKVTISFTKELRK